MSKRYNLREYYRPTDLGEAKKLLGRKNIRTIPLAGGVAVVGEASPDVEAVVDLDGLGLDFIEDEGGLLRIGAMVRLQTIVEKLSDHDDGLLADSARRTAGWHIRNSATVGGTLAGGDSHAPFSVALAALGARVTLDNHSGDPMLWAELSKEIRQKGLKGRLITAISLTSARLGGAYQQVGRTPADRPIVSAAAVALESDDDVQVTVCIGGLLHDLLIGTQTVKGIETEKAVELVVGKMFNPDTAESGYVSDFRGSAEYRREIAPVLARRTVQGALSRLKNAIP